MNNWKYTTFVKKGLFHVKSDLECQDKVLIKENSKVIIAALADGLGSYRFSEIAANSTVEAVCEYYLSKDNNPTEQGGKSELIKYVRERIISDAEKAEKPLDLMDCTMMFVLIKKDSNQVYIGRLGDSNVCVIKDDPIAINDGNATANGTCTVLSNNAEESLEIYSFDLVEDGITGFVMSSDGLENELYMKGLKRVNKNTEIYYNALLSDSTKEIIEERINKLTETEDTPFDDDISVAVIICGTDPLYLPNNPTWLCTCGQRNYLFDTFCVNCDEDFVSLYKGIDFSNYGGKDNFFHQINQFPERETKLLNIEKTKENIDHLLNEHENISEKKSNGIRLIFEKNNSSEEKTHNKAEDNFAGDGNKNPQFEENNQKIETNQDNQDDKDCKSNNPKKDDSKENLKHTNKKQFYWVEMSVVLITGIIVGSLISALFLSKNIKSLSNKVDELTTLYSKVIEENNEYKTQLALVPENFHNLGNNSYFMGDVHDDLPDGNGVLYNNGTYYIGNFNFGKKNGRFIVIEQKEFEMETNYYVDDQLDENHMEIDKIVLKIDTDINLRSEPTTSENNVIVTLHSGDIVLVFQSMSVFADDYEWIKVFVPTIGENGWIVKDFLVH